MVVVVAFGTRSDAGSSSFSRGVLMKYRASTVRALGIIRLLVGVTTFVAPRLAPRSMGITQPDRDGGTVARMFAIRDAGLALATLSAEPAVRDTGLRLGVLADA